ncbi:unnamed protein product, partial [Effrenium voratum]
AGPSPSCLNKFPLTTFSLKSIFADVPLLAIYLLLTSFGIMMVGHRFLQIQEALFLDDVKLIRNGMRGFATNDLDEEDEP